MTALRSEAAVLAGKTPGKLLISAGTDALEKVQNVHKHSCHGSEKQGREQIHQCTQQCGSPQTEEHP